MADTLTTSGGIDGSSRRAVVHDVIGELTPPVVICNPTAETIRAVAGALDPADAEGSAVVARYEALRRIRDTFGAAATLAERTADGLGLCVLPDPPETTLFVGADRYYALVRGEESVVALPATTDVSDVRAYTRRLAREAEPFPLRTPPLSVVRATMCEEFGESFCDAFDAALGPLSDLSTDPSVTVPDLLLVLAARHGLLLYDLSKWGEDVGIASRATFSRRKTRLEDAGVIAAEPAPTEFGRPRHRLAPAGPAFRDADPDRLVERIADATD